MEHAPILAVGASAVNRSGIFAGEHITKGAVVLRIQGTVLSLDAFFRIPQKARDNTYRLRTDAYLDPKETLGKFINHSCEPNSKIVKKSGYLSLIALKRIPKGAEIFFDYSTVLAKDDFWVMHCRCGTKSCRGVIKNYTSLPPKVLKRYIKEDILPLYIQKIPPHEGTD
ncbi:SET domain-containing protein-lysine N-methyltransferase [Patescibacteria group bacterium]|nr:SET domain-containing protein-lysine N-methyltransferase [Patescibacteria group bacterium]